MLLTADHFALWYALGEVHSRKKVILQNMEQYHIFLLDVFQQFQETVALDSPCVQIQPDFQSLAETRGPFFAQPRLSEQLLHSCPFGHVFASRFADWWCELQWGEGLPVSFHELYVSFCLQTQTMAPVVLGQKRYGLRDLCHEADIAPLSFVLQLNVWDKMIMWWMRLSHQPMPIQRVDALHKYGYSYRVKGFMQRPILHNVETMGQELWRYFHPQNPGRTRRSLQFAWCVQSRCPHAAYGGG